MAVLPVSTIAVLPIETQRQKLREAEKQEASNRLISHAAKAAEVDFGDRLSPLRFFYKLEQVASQIRSGVSEGIREQFLRKGVCADHFSFEKANRRDEVQAWNMMIAQGLVNLELFGQRGNYFGVLQAIYGEHLTKDYNKLLEAEGWFY